MNEENRIANEQNRESPILDSMEKTHANYNANLKLVIDNLGPKDKILVASHNIESVSLAKKLLIEKNI